jgi:hypothetical protein
LAESATEALIEFELNLEMKKLRIVDTEFFAVIF